MLAPAHFKPSKRNARSSQICTGAFKSQALAFAIRLPTSEAFALGAYAFIDLIVSAVKVKKLDCIGTRGSENDQKPSGDCCRASTSAIAAVPALGASF